MDLADPAQRLAFQITTEATTDKIRDTHALALAPKFAAHFDKIILLFLVNKAPPPPKPSRNFIPCLSPAIEVRDLSSILTDIRALDIPRMTAVADLLDQEIHDPTKPWNRDASLRPANLPYATLGSLFKGRDDFLTDLHERLTGHSATLIKGHAIHGLGGVGKTRAAVEYAWRYQSHYTALLFVSADSPDTLDTKLAALCHADVLNLPEKALTDQNEQKAAVLTWLNTHPGWLLILDNADTDDALAAVDQLLPRLAGGHVLITSRMTDYAGGIDALALDVLADGDAAAFLLERTADHRTKVPDDNARALELARELGGLALALEQAAAHIRKDRLSFASYLDLWHHNTAAALHWYNSRTMRHPSSLAVTYQTTVAQLSPAAAEFFRVIAWFAPDPIPFSALEGRHAPPAARALLAELENLSLARRDAAGTSFTLHRLVQEITRQQQSAPPPPPTLLVALKWLHGLFSYQADDIRTWPVAEPLAPHTHAAALHAAAHNIPEPTAGLLNRVALLYKAKARHDAAEPLMRQALAIDEATFGKDDPAVATDLNNLALLLKDTNRLAEAESLLRRALSIDEAAPAKDHPNISRDLINLAQVLYITNRLDEAEALVRRALAIDEATYGKNHPTFATSLNSLATLLMSTGRLDEAEAHYRDVLAIDEAVLGKDHPKVAIVLNNLTLLLCESKRFTEAEPLTRRALAIDEAHFGMVHPQVAIHLRTLASVLQKTNRHADAEPLMRLALEIYVEFTRTTGHEHSHLTEACENYSLLLEAMGDTPAQIEEKLARLLAHLRPAGP